MDLCSCFFSEINCYEVKYFFFRLEKVLPFSVGTKKSQVFFTVSILLSYWTKKITRTKRTSGWRKKKNLTSKTFFAVIFFFHPPFASSRLQYSNNCTFFFSFFKFYLYFCFFYYYFTLIFLFIWSWHKRIP